MKKIIILFAMFFVNMAFAELPYFPIEFPRDEYAHHENVPYPVTNMTEWWYYNGRFTTKAGRSFGYYLTYTYLQTMQNNKKTVLPALMIQITDIDKKKVYGKTVFASIHDSHFSTDSLDIAIGKNITLRQEENNTFNIDGIIAGGKEQPNLQYSIKATPSRNVLLIDKTGYIDMFDGQHSYYYSYTRMKSSGYIQIGNERFDIDPDHSLLWMDHQWGDFIIKPGKHEWFFTLIQLENGMDFMMTVPYDSQNKKYQDELGFSSIIMPDDSRVYAKNQKLTPHIVPGNKHTQNWDISIPEVNLELRLNSFVPGQDLNWISEAASQAEGFLNGIPVRGTGNVESSVAYKI